MRKTPAAGLTGVIVAISLAAAGIAATGATGRAATGATGRAATPGCPPPGAHLIARGRILRVYTPGPGTYKGAIEACLTGRAGRMTLLAARTPGPGPIGRSLQVNAWSGPLVAYTLTSFGVDSGTTSLLVADVAARRILRQLPTGHYVDAGLGGYERSTKVVLGPEGAVGWIAATSGPGHQSPAYSVHAAATIGEPHVLDEGPDIGPASLTLTGRTLHWWHAGIEHSARLP